MNTTSSGSGFSVGRLVSVALFTAFAAAGPLRAQNAVGLEGRVEMDLGGPGSGIVAGVVSDGQIDFLEAWGTPSAGATDSLEVTALFAYPALTEILVAMTVRALGDAGMLDPNAPLSSYLSGRTGTMGQVTLDQLLSHTSGLANTALQPGQSWADALDALGDGAFVAEPGQIYSDSRFSYPVAASVLEQLLGAPFRDIATTAVLTPLGMTASTFDPDTARARGLATGYAVDSTGVSPVAPAATFNGLPILYTTTPNVLQLLTAWMDGGIRGSSPIRAVAADVPRLDPTRRYGDGIVQDVAALVPNAWLNRREAGFGTAIHMYPENATALFIWSNGSVPTYTLGWIRQLVAEAVGDVETSLAGQGVAITRTVDASATPAGLEDLEEWAGLYRNGPAMIGLRYVGGQLYFFDGTRDIPLVGQGPATFSYGGTDGTGPPLQLVRVGDQNMVLFSNLAYAWESSEVPPPKGG